MRKLFNFLVVLFSMLSASFIASCSNDIIDDFDDVPTDYEIYNVSAVNEDFMTNWENIQTVKVNTTNGIDSTATPWSQDATITVLPDEICFDVKKKDGWEMVFSSLGDPNIKDANYFALYNRYLGTLRVFCYVNDASGIGSEASFGVKLGSTNFKVPFYHSLAYSVPTSHTEVNTKLNIAGSADSFYAYYSPYTITGVHVPTRGWCAFDIDMSAYNTHPETFLNSDKERINLFCSTVSKSDVKLSGTLDAGIKGQYSSAEVAQNASSASGIGSTLKMIGELVGDTRTSSLVGMEAAMTKSMLNKYCYYAGVVFKGAAWIADYITDNPYSVDDIDDMPGKLDMNLTGTIDLSGYITSLVPNNIPSLKLGTGIMNHDNPYFASGVWSLESDPVVYISGNKFMGKSPRVNFVVGKDGAYNSSRLDNNELRMMAFLDPTSVKVNLNPNLFKNIKDVTVQAYYGVFPEEPAGSTLAYQALMKMKDRDSVCLVNHAKKHEGDLYTSISHTDAMDYIQYAKEKFIDSNDSDEEKKLYQTVKQEGSNYQYYGAVMSGGNGKGKKYVLEPQIFFPISSDNNTIYDGKVPDLVVSVFVTVEADGNLYTYNRNFIPEVKILPNASDFAPIRKNLTDYLDAAKSGGSTVHVNNMPSVPVKFMDSDKKFPKIINYIDIITK